MFWFLISVRCTGNGRPSNFVRVSSNGAVWSFYFGFIGIVYITLSRACEILIFEMLLCYSIFVDFCSPSAVSKLKWFLSYLLVFTTSYFGFTMATIAFAVASPDLVNSIQSQSFAKHAAGIILSNALAVAGGVYFLWTMHHDSIALGRHSILSLRQHTVDNAKKICTMKRFAKSQVELAFRCFVLSLAISKEHVANNTCGSEQMQTLSERLSLPSHLYAACLQLTPENLAAIEGAFISLSRKCCKVSVLKFSASSGAMR